MTDIPQPQSEVRFSTIEAELKDLAKQKVNSYNGEFIRFRRIALPVVMILLGAGIALLIFEIGKIESTESVLLAISTLLLNASALFVGFSRPRSK